MDKTTVSFKVPFNYEMCLKADCTQAANCLRQIALREIPDTQHSFMVINPRVVAAVDGQCADYRPAGKVLFGKGFKKFFDELPRKQGEIFAKLVIGRFNRSDYFYMRKGDKSVSPSKQLILQELLLRAGATSPLVFDEYIETFDW